MLSRPRPHHLVLRLLELATPYWLLFNLVVWETALSTDTSTWQWLQLVAGQLENLLAALMIAAVLVGLLALKLPLLVVLAVAWLAALLIVAERLFLQVFYAHFDPSYLDGDWSLWVFADSVSSEIRWIDGLNLLIVCLLSVFLAGRLRSAGASIRWRPSAWVLLAVVAAFTLLTYFPSADGLQRNVLIRNIVYLADQRQLAPDVPVSDVNYDLIFGRPPSRPSLDLTAVEESVRHRFDKPNVILLVMESVGSLQLFPDGVIDAALTPNLFRERDKLLLFNALYGLFPSTSRTHLMIQTGGFGPSYHSVTDFLSRKYRGATLVSELSRADYRTALFSAQDLGFENLRMFYKSLGFDRYFEPEEGGAYYKQHKVHSWGVHEKPVLRKALDWMAQQSAPFFLQFLTVSSHHPYGYTGQGDETRDLSRLERYQRSLRDMDALFQQLLDGLKSQGILDNTLIFIVGDHGQAFGLRHIGNYTHKNFLYEENMKNFMLLYDPRASYADAVVNRPGAMGDVMPSILALATDRGPVGNIPGQNLFSPSYKARVQYFHKTSGMPLWGVRDGQWKFIINPLDEDSAELYDLGTDPQEQVNLIARFPDRRGVYADRLTDWFVGAGRQFPEQYDESLGEIALTAEDVRSAGPKVLRLGIKKAGQSFEPLTAFHPDEDIVADVVVVPNNQAHEFLFRWTSPDGDVTEHQLETNAEWNSVFSDLDYPRPMSSGAWRVEVYEDGSMRLEESFRVSADAQLRDPRERALRSSRDASLEDVVRAGPLLLQLGVKKSGQEFRALEAIHPDEDIRAHVTLKSDHRPHDYVFRWTDPDGKTLQRRLRVRGEWAYAYSDLDYPEAMKAGTWRIELYVDGKKSLQQSFPVHLDAELVDPRERALQRLASASIQDGSIAGPQRLQLGVKRSGKGFRELSRVHPDEDIRAQVLLVSDTQSHELVFRWISPDGEVTLRRLAVKPDWSFAFSELDHPLGMPVGRWRVEVYADGRKRLEQSFRVTQDAALFDPRIRALK